MTRVKQFDLNWQFAKDEWDSASKTEVQCGQTFIRLVYGLLCILISNMTLLYIYL